jgi:hypothetical protein
MLGFGVHARCFTPARDGRLSERLKPLVPGRRGAGSEAVRTAYPDLFRIQNSSSPFQTTVCPAPLAEVPPPGSASSIAVVCADRFPRD